MGDADRTIGLSWSQAEPTEPGWYWWRPSNAAGGLYPTVRYVAAAELGHLEPGESCGEYAGPIHPPADKP